MDWHGNLCLLPEIVVRLDTQRLVSDMVVASDTSQSDL